MKTFQFKALFQANSYLSPAYVSIDESGKIIALSENEPQNQDKIEKVDGFALPSFMNAHSHAFQYAMAGLGEIHPVGQEADDFWSWREAMYDLALSINPEQMKAIASMLYAEMLRHGYSHVAEFHYVHHDRNGKTYTNIAEMGEALLQAAQETGMKITLIPIFYQKGGFGQEAQEKQRRFISKDLEFYHKLLESSQKAVQNYENVYLGIGIHSLRAIEPDLVPYFSGENFPNLPIHIHVSEQLREVNEAKEYLGQRPVEWLINNTRVDENFHLVHATHLQEQEIRAIVNSKANVVLCPSTEGNLGDGLFPLKEFQDLGGKWSIGTDSHIGLNPLEDLRILDYGQRLTRHKRHTFTSASNGNSGNYALQQTIFNGRKAMRNMYQTKDFFQIGEKFDAVLFDAGQALLENTSVENLISTIVYSADVSMILGTIINGSWIVQNQKHENLIEIKSNFSKAIKELSNR